MFSKVFLAGIGANPLPRRFAYMALHFSAYGNGLSNMPGSLPKGSIILLDDSLEPKGHDPDRVAEQLAELAERLSPFSVLLDFQRSVTEELKIMAERIVKALTCPVGVTEGYAKDLGCPAFLPPPAANKSLEDYIAPWKEQGVFLEIAPEGLEITVTETGSHSAQIPLVPGLPLEDKRLLCHYNVEIHSEKAVVTICRYREDLAALALKAEKLGVLGCICLYSELIQ